MKLVDEKGIKLETTKTDYKQTAPKETPPSEGVTEPKTAPEEGGGW